MPGYTAFQTNKRLNLLTTLPPHVRLSVALGVSHCLYEASVVPKIKLDRLRDLELDGSNKEVLILIRYVLHLSSVGVFESNLCLCMLIP